MIWDVGINILVQTMSEEGISNVEHKSLIVQEGVLSPHCKMVLGLCLIWDRSWLEEIFRKM